MGDNITTVQDSTGSPTRGIEGEDSLDGHIHGGCVEGLEHDLGHLFSIGGKGWWRWVDLRLLLFGLLGAGL